MVGTWEEREVRVFLSVMAQPQHLASNRGCCPLGQVLPLTQTTALSPPTAPSGLGWEQLPAGSGPLDAVPSLMGFFNLTRTIERNQYISFVKPDE